MFNDKRLLAMLLLAALFALAIYLRVAARVSVEAGLGKVQLEFGQGR
jgi:hypothetical protein